MKWWLKSIIIVFAYWYGFMGVYMAYLTVCLFRDHVSIGSVVFVAIAWPFYGVRLAYLAETFPMMLQ